MVGRLLKGLAALDHRGSQPTRLLAALGGVLQRAQRNVPLGHTILQEPPVHKEVPVDLPTYPEAVPIGDQRA